MCCQIYYCKTDICIVCGATTQIIKYKKNPTSKSPLLAGENKRPYSN